MGLRGLEIRAEYRTPRDSFARDFLVPALQESVIYKRAVGYFSSTALIEMSRGLGSLAKRGGKIQLVASPALSDEDVEAIRKGYKLRDEVLRDALYSQLRDPANDEEADRLNLLASLVADDVLDIRIALMENPDGFGIYHEKLAIFTDQDGDTVVGAGSMNETRSAFLANYETVDVFKSWSDPEGRVPIKESAFDAIWENNDPSVHVCDFLDLGEEIIKRYKRSEPDYNIDFRVAEELAEVTCAPSHNTIGTPRTPSYVNFYQYQKEAINNWVEKGYSGLFDMATGSGKTYTALGALVEAFRHSSGALGVFIVCPYQHLVEQWVEDIEAFGINPIIAYSSSSQRDWETRLSNAIFDKRIGVPEKEFYCCVCTNATFNGDYIQDQLSQITGDALIVADEVHHMGATSYQKSLSEVFNYRLGLSATIERYRDPEGTAAIYTYFGEICINYTIEEAIEDGTLTEYKYFPVITHLNNQELTKYEALTKKFNKYFAQASDNKDSAASKEAERIAQERARLVAGASNKISGLKEQINKYIKNTHILVYCGAAKILPEGEDFTEASEDDIRQIAAVDELLGLDLKMKISNFTSEETIGERKNIKAQFEKGNLQALVAIKCLDEGVNIPGIRTAFILASTTNPREYIQRRGRLLRRSEGKKYAEIYDFITLPRPLQDVYGMSEKEIRGDLSLIRNELKRASEFISSARNRSSAQAVIDEILAAYRLNVINLVWEEGS